MSTTTILAVFLAVAVVLLAGTMGRYLRQARDLDDAHAQLAAQRAHCEQQHLGDLAATTETTRPTGPPPLDALVLPVRPPVLPLGHFPVNPPYRRSN